MSDDIRHAALSDIGRRRARNEDSMVVEPDLGLFLVADGMGGHEHGDVASKLAAELIHEAVAAGEDLEDAIRRANRHILGQSGAGSPFPMGTTVCAVLMNGSTYRLAWVGDSRAYRFNGDLERLTTDHTYVQELVDRGHLNDRQAREHPYRNMLLQALGVTDQDELQVAEIQGELAPGEGLLLCTDGLTGELDDDDISGILAGGGDLESDAKELIDRALEHGGNDNVTLILIRRDSN